jgi:hypothetical protein
VLIQASIGMVVNLDVTIPALVIVVTGLAVRAFAVPSRPVRAWSILGGLLVIGAGFNGASFLDFNKDISSLIMALLAFAALACYAIVLFLLAGGRQRAAG